MQDRFKAIILAFVLFSVANLHKTAFGQILISSETITKDKYFAVSISIDNGKSWLAPVKLSNNAEKIKSFSVSTKELYPSIAWIEDENFSEKIYYYSFKKDFIPKEVINSFDKIDSICLLEPNFNSPFIIYKSGQYLRLVNSVDGGNTWSKPQSFFTNILETTFECLIEKNSFIVKTASGSNETIIINDPDPPYFSNENPTITLSDNFYDVKNYKSLKTNDLATAYIFQISSDKEFKNPIDITIEENSKINIPSDLKFGNYYARIMAWNGLKSSFSKTKTLKYFGNIDQKNICNIIKPNITDWIKPMSTAAFEFSFENPPFKEDIVEVGLYLNNILLESSLEFGPSQKSIKGVALIPQNISHGENQLKLTLIKNEIEIATFESKINIDAKAPEIELENLTRCLYTNSRDKITLKLIDEGSGADLSKSDIKVLDNYTTIEGNLLFDLTSSSITFIPKQKLSKDSYNITAKIFDKANNNTIYDKIPCIIDDTPIKITLSPTTNETTQKNINIEGEINKKNIKTIEIKNQNGSAKKVVFKNNKFWANLDLQRGENSISITVQDPAGNISTAQQKIFLFSPPEKVVFLFDGIPLQNGDFVRNNISDAKIVDDQGNGISGATVVLDDLPISYDTSTGTVEIGTLAKGKHTIRLTAEDENFQTTFFVDDSLKINNILACPNPFNPLEGKAQITYNVSKDCDINLYIFDINGQIVYKQNCSATTGFNNNLSWDGKDSQNQLAANGIYIVKLIAKDNSQNISSANGKIIILK